MIGEAYPDSWERYRRRNPAGPRGYVGSDRRGGLPAEKPAVPRKPVHMTVVDFVGSLRNPRAVVHYSDGSQEVVSRSDDPGRYGALHDQFTPKQPIGSFGSGDDFRWP
jgi:hypothetical protein